MSLLYEPGNILGAKDTARNLQSKLINSYPHGIFAIAGKGRLKKKNTSVFNISEEDPEILDSEKKKAR